MYVLTVIWDLANLCQFDHINQMIALLVIPLSMLNYRVVCVELYDNNKQISYSYNAMYYVLTVIWNLANLGKFDHIKQMKQ
jgi:hypothetical protein